MVSAKEPSDLHIEIQVTDEEKTQVIKNFAAKPAFLTSKGSAMIKFYETATRVHSGHPTTKPLDYYKRYDDFLNHHKLSPRSVVEIGTFQGESTKIFARGLPEAKILSLDLHMRPIDFSAYPNVAYAQADQRKPDQLIAKLIQYFPEGIDLVIEDASHIGLLSKLTFDAVFPLLRSGGAYFIEDWGTGYWDSWLDGSRFEYVRNEPYAGNIPKRFPSHDFGMVGFVKSLVDLTHESAIKNRQEDESKFSSRVSVLEFGEGICMLLKS